MFNKLSAYQPQFLSVLRIAAGLMFLCHGTAKVLGFPAVEGVPGPGLSLAGLSGPLELVFGALLVLGLFTRPVAFLASGFCAVGYWLMPS
ncbi:MAG: DoxX family protein [Brevundimonas sp.]|nr:MAG: DoxX family protein [Brevundimonas sp.]